METNLIENKRIHIDLGSNVELSITRKEDGTITVSVDNGSLVISPNGSNSIDLLGLIHENK